MIRDKNGKVVRELEGPWKRGFNRVNWDLRQAMNSSPEWKPGEFYYPLRGPMVLPGEYEVKLMAAGQEMVQKVTVKLDSRIKASEEALPAKLKAGLRVNDMVRAFLEAKAAVQAIEKEVVPIQESSKKQANFPEDAKSLLDEISKNLEGFRKEFIAEMEGMEFELLDLMGQLDASTSRPTEAQGMIIERLMVKLDKGINTVNSLLTEKLPELQKKLRCGDFRLAGLQPIKLPER